MSQTAIHEPLVPKSWIVSACALVLFSLAAVTAVRLTGVGGTRMKLPAMVESRDLLFEDGKNGAVLVFDARDHTLIDSLAPGTNGFVRVVLRGLARERRLGDIGRQPPFRIARFENGQMTLTDTATNKQIDLVAFGSSNSEAFTRLMSLNGRAR